MKFLLHRGWMLLLVAGALSAGGCHFLSATTAPTANPAAKLRVNARKVSSDTIPNASEVGL